MSSQIDIVAIITPKPGKADRVCTPPRTTQVILSRILAVVIEGRRTTGFSKRGIFADMVT